jgi:hypothetical protein
VVVVRLDDDGRVVRHEAFPEDRWPEALAMFDEWVGFGEAIPEGR